MTPNFYHISNENSVNSFPAIFSPNLTNIIYLLICPVAEQASYFSMTPCGSDCDNEIYRESGEYIVYSMWNVFS